MSTSNVFAIMPVRDYADVVADTLATASPWVTRIFVLDNGSLDGTVDIVEESGVLPGERSYWGASHRLLIADFYASLDSGIPFWIGAEEATASLRIIKDVYSRSYPAGGWL